MALIKCIECDRDMSDTLNACPHCGFKRVILQKLETQSISEINPNKLICAVCSTLYHKEAKECPYCKERNVNQQFTGNSTPKVSNLKSMVKCDCGYVYSIYTKSCPSCKQVNSNHKKTPILKFALIAFAVIIVGSIISNGVDTDTNISSSNNLNKIVNNNIASQNTVYKIGDRGPAGGWVFYDKGHSKGGWRYLEAAPEDIKGRINWSHGKLLKIGSTAANIGSGKKNTQRLLNIYGNKNSAGKLCSDYRGGGKSDWFLPSKDELNLMYKYLHKMGIGDFSNEVVYWSSTEYNAERAWLQDFDIGMQDQGVKSFYDEPLSDTSGDTFVRAIRAF